MYFSVTNAAWQYLNDITSVSWGKIPLSPGGANTAVYYSEFVNGTGTFQAASRSLGNISCGPVTEQVGSFDSIRCKYYPTINSLTPLLQSVPGRVVQTGGNIKINGVGFGATKCGACSVTIYPGPYTLTPSSWTDSAITVSLPSSWVGFSQIVVQTASGKDVVNFMGAPAQ
jgi:hypothetical protein